MTPDDLLEAEEADAVWYGDPWTYDVQCAHCQHVYRSTQPDCPHCGSNAAEPLS